MPRAQGGGDDRDNTLIVCPYCHDQLHAPPRAIEFAALVSEVMIAHGGFRKVRALEHQGNAGPQPDIGAERLVDGKWVPIAVECKGYTGFSGERMTAILNQLTALRAASKVRQIALAVPARLTRSQKHELQQARVEVWDADGMNRVFATQLESSGRPLAIWLRSAGRELPASREDDLLDRLTSCARGRAACYDYQKLVGEALQYLFCPPLSNPFSEFSDEFGINRPDLVFPNYAVEGFWSYMRARYQADYIVVDAKNYSRAVDKKDVLQVGNYIKAHGAGLFGLICCRGTQNRGCYHTQREQWAIYGKLIVVIDDADLEAMIEAKRVDGIPEQVLQQKIESFRLRM